MYEQDKEKIEDYLLTHLGPQALSKVEIVDKAVSNLKSLYHISTDSKLRFFYPRVSQKLYPNETTQIPRTSTSPSLLQCLLGYGGFYQDTTWRSEKFNGIYFIYEPEWDIAFKPAKSLVGDVEYSDEHWLLYYKKELYKRPCVRSGEFFVRSIDSVLKGDKSEDEYVVFLKVDKDGLEIIPGKALQRGFYRLTLQQFKTPNYDYRLDENVFIELIDHKQYQWGYAIRTNKVGK